MIGALRSKLNNTHSPFTVDLREPKIAIFAREINGQLDVGLPIPTPQNHHNLINELAAALNAQLPLETWPLRLLIGSGWLIITMAADNADLISAYLALMNARGGVIGGRILFYCYLRHYPYPYLEVLRNTIIKLLTSGTGKAALMRKASAYQSLLVPNAPLILARNLLKNDLRFYLTQLGLTGELANGGFIEATWERLVAEVRAAQHLNVDHKVKALLALSLDNAAKLRFPNRIKELAEALLVNWIGRGIELPIGITNLLINQLGDPRVNHAWSEITEDAHEVIKQSLTGEVIADFFSLLENITTRDSVIDDYISQRRAFWEFCRAKGTLTDAWLAVGSLLLPEAQRRLGVRARHYAELGTTTGARARHVALMLRISGITIVEWSHARSYYLWHPINAAAPQFYQANYNYEALENNADFARSRQDDYDEWRAGIPFLKTYEKLFKIFFN